MYVLEHVYEIISHFDRSDCNTLNSFASIGSVQKGVKFNAGRKVRL